MSKLNEFLTKTQDAPEEKPVGVEWFASVRCGTCGEDVDEQTLFMSEKLLVWTCSRGHRGHIENYAIF